MQLRVSLSLFFIFSTLTSTSILFGQYRESLSKLTFASSFSTSCVSDSAYTIVRQKLDPKHLALKNDYWLGSDKQKHFLASFAILLAAKASTKSLLQFDKMSSSVAATGVTLFVGFIKEILDDLNPKNIFSLKDLTADIAGIIVALLLISVLNY